MSNSSSGSSAIGLPTLLTVAFAVLKLCKVIDWVLVVGVVANTDSDWYLAISHYHNRNNLHF